MTKYSAIITAGGTSSRYGKKNKLLEKITDKTVIEYTVEKFTGFDNITEIIIPTNQDYIEDFHLILGKYKNVKIIPGGQNRQQSVYNALKEVKEDYVLIHDGARPLIEQESIKLVMEEVIKKGAVTLASKTTDTIKVVDNNKKIKETLDRTFLYNIQTPQAFKTNIIKNAHEKYKNESFTDDCLLLEKCGQDVYVIENSPTNIKITSKSDLEFAKLYI